MSLRMEPVDPIRSLWNYSIDTYGLNLLPIHWKISLLRVSPMNSLISILFVAIFKAGRRMFPILEFKAYGLKPEASYEIYIEMVPIDLHPWKFNSGKWIPSGQTDERHQSGRTKLFKKRLKNSFEYSRSSFFAS